ncbi:hypothetical protein ACMFMF_009711 [Clarireedia jacksonii]
MDSTKNDVTTTRTQKSDRSPADLHLDTNTHVTPPLSSSFTSEQRRLQYDGKKSNEDSYIYESPTDYNNISTSCDISDTTIKHCADYYLPSYEIEIAQYDDHFTLEEHLTIVDNNVSAPYSRNSANTTYTPGAEAHFPELSPILEDWSTHISRDEKIRLGIPVFQQ